MKYVQRQGDADLYSAVFSDSSALRLHGIKGWEHIPADDIASILNVVLRRLPVVLWCDRPYRVQNCPNCGHPVRPMRQVFLQICKKSAKFRKLKLKTPSLHICSQCGLDIRRVKIR